MTPEAQRIAIAEACGWRDIKPNKFGRLKGSPRPWAYNQSVPDYLNDLNAMHEVERSADYHVGDYCRFLQLVTSGGNVENMTNYNLLHASASQRAEAFLKTLGKWEGGK
jgi:hypothetical protein